MTYYIVTTNLTNEVPGLLKEKFPTIDIDCITQEELTKEFVEFCNRNNLMIRTSHSHICVNNPRSE